MSDTVVSWRLVWASRPVTAVYWGQFAWQIHITIGTAVSSWDGPAWANKSEDCLFKFPSWQFMKRALGEIQRPCLLCRNRAAQWLCCYLSHYAQSQPPHLSLCIQFLVLPVCLPLHPTAWQTNHELAATNFLSVLRSNQVLPDAVKHVSGFSSRITRHGEGERVSFVSTVQPEDKERFLASCLHGHFVCVQLSIIHWKLPAQGYISGHPLLSLWLRGQGALLSKSGVF